VIFWFLCPKSRPSPKPSPKRSGAEITSEFHLLVLLLCYWLGTTLEHGETHGVWELVFDWCMEAQGRRCTLLILSSLLVCRDNPWKAVFVIRTVPCNATYRPTYLPTYRQT
jgi:hypothetical protein